MQNKRSKQRSRKGVMLLVAAILLVQLGASLDTITVSAATKTTKYVSAYLRGRQKSNAKADVKCTFVPGTKVTVVSEKHGWSKLSNGAYCKSKYLFDTKRKSLKEAKKSAENFHTTGYCSCRTCSGGYGSDTCSGRKARSNHTIAADLKVLPLYTKVYIEGLGKYEVEDVGGGVKGNHIDIYADKHSDCDALNLKKIRVYILKG